MADPQLVLKKFVPEKDCPRIAPLNKKVWNMDTTDDYWRWKYIAPPFECPGWVVDDENGSMVAFTGFWNRTAKFGNTTRASYLMIDMMSDPNYRGGKAYGVIKKKLIEMLIDGGILIYGFPNEVSYGPVRRLMGQLLKIDETQPISTCVINPATLIEAPKVIKSMAGGISRRIIGLRFVGRRKNIMVERVFEAGHEFNQLWEEVKEEYNWIQNRESDFLTWRYLNEPTKSFQVWAAKEEGRLVGYMITNVNRRPNKTKARIVDWLVPRERVDVFKSLLQAVLVWFVQEKVDVADTWLVNREDQWMQVLKSHLFINGKRNKSFYLMLHDYLGQDMDLFRADNIFATIGDSDFAGSLTG